MNAWYQKLLFKVKQFSAGTLCRRCIFYEYSPSETIGGLLAVSGGEQGTINPEDMEEKRQLKTLVSVLEKVRQEGYTLDFRVTDDGVLSTMDDEQQFRPEQVQIVNFYRFEGESYPGDMAILYVLETDTGAKGTISDAYGTYADDTVEAFMRQVRDLGKDLDKHSR